MSCLYDSLAQLERHHGGSSRAVDVRALLANAVADGHLLNGIPSSQWQRWETGESTLAYVARIRQPESWGGALELALFASLRQTDLQVHSTGGITISFPSPLPASVTYHLDWTGTHYSPTPGKNGGASLT